MKALFHCLPIRILFVLLVACGAASAQAQRSFAPAELEALLAPVALYPDPLLQQILDASLHPQELAAAAQWSRANPQLSGDAALATVQGTAWPPSVKALVAYPEVLQRMQESPQWLHDLGEAYAAYGLGLMDTVQTLRARAQASGYLQSNDEQYVYDQGGQIYVQPVYPNTIYVPYYNPYVVYGGWGWSVYRPPHWRPWVPHHSYARRAFPHPYAPRAYQHPYTRHAYPQRHEHIEVRPYHRVPESQRQPFVHGGGAPYIHSAPVRPSPAPARPFAREPSRTNPFAHRGHAGRPPAGNGGARAANPFARR